MLLTLPYCKEGPYKVEGLVDLAWPSGHEIAHAENRAIFLCRCGHSENKPFCDGSHKRVGFKPTEGDETAHKD